VKQKDGQTVATTGWTRTPTRYADLNAFLTRRVITGRDRRFTITRRVSTAD